MNDLETVVLLVVAGVSAIGINFIPPLSLPFETFFTTVHELGHGLVATLTGGKFVGYVVKKQDIIGGTSSQFGGVTFFVAQAGYLSEAVVSAGLIILGGTESIARPAAAGLGVILILLVLVFAQSNCLTLYSGVLWGMAFVGVAIQANLVWSIFLINFLAFFGGVSTFAGLRILFSGSSDLETKTDAKIMAELTGCPAIFWTLLWTLISFLLLVGAFWLTWGPRL